MIRRNITQNLLDALGESPVVFVNGARQVGKSTLARLIVEERGGRYLTLDEADILAAAAVDPRGFLADLDGFAVIDEVQRAPELMRAVKAAVDNDRRPGRLLLTGSANVLTLPAISESLAGRMQIFTLHPLSQGELAGRRECFIDAVFSDKLPDWPGAAADLEDIEERCLRGGFPELVAGTQRPRRDRWFASYITAILQRDVRDIADIAGLHQMPRLLALLAARSTSLLNRSDLARDLGWPRTTVDRYLTLLEMIFLYELLPAWSGNLGRRLMRAPKILLQDSGLAAHLTGASPEGGAPPELVGRLLENFVIMEIRKQASWSRTDVRLHHYRSAAGQEVDLLLEDRRGRIVAIEIKSTATPGAAAFSALRRLAGDLGERFHRGLLLSRGPQRLAFGERLFALPIPAVWREPKHR